MRQWNLQNLVTSVKYNNKISQKQSKFYFYKFLYEIVIAVFLVSIVNLLYATGLFLYYLKTSDKQIFSDVFLGVKKETSSMKWFKSIK